MNKYLKYFLIAVILLGIFLRFYQLDKQFIYGDEEIEILASLKLHHQSWYSGVNYESPHPPLAKWLMGIPTKDLGGNEGRNFLPLLTDNPPTYTFAFIAYEMVLNNYVSMRVVSAIAGTLFVIFIFLLARKSFGTDAGIWAGLLAATSADMIFFSRVAMNDNFMVLFSVITLYFYSEYLKISGKKKYIFILLTAFFLFLALGTRSVQPLFLIPTILLGQAFFKKDIAFLRENLIFLVLILFSIYSIYFVLYKPEITLFDKLGVKSVFDLVGFSFDRFSVGLFLRNSYLHLISLVLILYIATKKIVFDTSSLAKNMLDNKGTFVFLIYFVMSYLLLGFSAAGDSAKNPFSSIIQYNNRYAIIFYPTLFIFGAYTLNKKSQGIMALVILVSIFASLWQIAPLIPNHIHDYSNFGIRGYEILDGSHNEGAEKSISFLKSVGDPPILSNNMNMLIFYQPSSALFRGDRADPRCTEENMKYIKSGGYLVVYEKTDSNYTSFFSDPNFCKLYLDNIFIEIYKTDQIMVYGQAAQNS